MVKSGATGLGLGCRFMKILQFWVSTHKDSDNDTMSLSLVPTLVVNKRKQTFGLLPQSDQTLLITVIVLLLRCAVSFN